MAYVAELSARILAAEKELSDAVEKTLIAVGSPAWIAAKAVIAELMRKENNLIEKQGEPPSFPMPLCIISRHPCMASDL